MTNSKNDFENVSIRTVIENLYGKDVASKIIAEIQDSYNYSASIQDNMSLIKGVLEKYKEHRTGPAESRVGTAVAIGVGIGIAA